MAEFHNTGNAAHALQAILMLRLLKSVIDGGLLTRLLAAERLEPAFALLAELADRPGQVGADEIRTAWDRLRTL